MKKPVKTEIVSVRLDRETKEWADACADAEDRPLSSWLARLIAEERTRSPRKRVRAPVTSSRPHRAA
jgi:hypothetical protein